MTKVDIEVTSQTQSASTVIIKRFRVIKKENFLDEIKSGALKSWENHGLLPSIVGAQAALESDWGSSLLAMESNNLFGVKASSDWTGGKKKYETKEQDSEGNETTIEAYFRVYDSWEDSVEDHGAFFTSTEWREENYKNVFGLKEYKRQAEEIQNAGYATDVKYADKLIGVIESNKLQEWDLEVLEETEIEVDVKSVNTSKSQIKEVKRLNVASASMNNKSHSSSGYRFNLILDPISNITSDSKVGFSIDSSYSYLIKTAIDYFLGDLEPIEDMTDAYKYDKFVFHFSLRNKKSVVVYVYDDNYDFDKEFDKATLKIYENEQWKTKKGGWVNALESYMQKLQYEIGMFGDSIKRRKQFEKEQRFALLFEDYTVQDGVVLWHWLPTDKQYKYSMKFSDTDTIDDFMKGMFDVDTIEIIES